jgi:hypothetical protein
MSMTSSTLDAGQLRRLLGSSGIGQTCRFGSLLRYGGVVVGAFPRGLLLGTASFGGQVLGVLSIDIVRRKALCGALGIGEAAQTELLAQRVHLLFVLLRRAERFLLRSGGLADDEPRRRSRPRRV